jgi:hypothetical protein
VRNHLCVLAAGEIATRGAEAPRATAWAYSVLGVGAA